MGMMSGYRQTEAGVLPNDWNVLQLISCCSKVTDGTHDTPKPVRTGVPFLTAIHIKDNWIDYESCLYVTKEDHSIIFSRCNPEKNDVLMVNIGAGVATTALVNVDYEFSLKNVALLKPDSRRVEGTYLNYALAHRKQAIIQDLSSGGAQPFLSLRQIGGILIPLPPTKAEQESIAEALRDVDAVVECLEQLLIKKRNIKHGAVQELLTGKKRLRGFGGEWTLKQLGEVGGISGSGVDKKLRSDELPVRLVNYMDAYRRDFIYGSDLDHWVTAPVHKIRRCAVQKGDVFFTPSSETRDDIANSAVAMEDIPDAVYSYHLVRLRLKEGWNLKFSAYAFKTRDFLDQAETLCDGSGTRYVISLGKFRSIQIKFPSFQEQEAIGSLLYDMDAEIAVLEAKLAKARQIKQGMMQELLTGRIRLVRPSASVVPFAVKQQADVNPSKSHNPQINEAVVLAALVSRFGTEQYPLARIRRTKMMYLLHRHVEHQTTGFLKKAAGPYNPQTRYGGPEKIALKNHYVRAHHNGTYEGFVPADKTSQAEEYFEKWYGSHVLEWIEQFRFKLTEELELLSTVDMASEDLRNEGKAVSLSAVKQVLRNNSEWKAKLNRPVFSDSKIAAAIQLCHQLFASEGETV